VFGGGVPTLDLHPNLRNFKAVVDVGPLAFERTLK